MLINEFFITDEKTAEANFQPVVEKNVQYHKIATQRDEINKNSTNIFQIFLILRIFKTVDLYNFYTKL